MTIIAASFHCWNEGKGDINCIDDKKNFSLLLKLPILTPLLDKRHLSRGLNPCR